MSEDTEPTFGQRGQSTDVIVDCRTDIVYMFEVLHHVHYEVAVPASHMDLGLLGSVRNRRGMPLQKL